jgi:hypothetical protein
MEATLEYLGSEMMGRGRCIAVMDLIRQGQCSTGSIMCCLGDIKWRVSCMVTSASWFRGVASRQTEGHRVATVTCHLWSPSGARLYSVGPGLTLFPGRTGFGPSGGQHGLRSPDNDEFVLPGAVSIIWYGTMNSADEPTREICSCERYRWK